MNGELAFWREEESTTERTPVENEKQVSFPMLSGKV